MARKARSSKRQSPLTNYFTFVRDLLYCMSIEEAAVLSHLAGVQEHEDKEWFLCSTERLCERLQLSERQHKRIMGSLYIKGFVEHRMFGQPARRHLRINTKEIQRAMHKAIDAMD